MKHLLLLLGLFFSGLNAHAQEFADKEYYLIDSLDLSTLSETDRRFLDSCLTIYHSGVHDTTKVKSIYDFVQLCENEIWFMYSAWVSEYSLHKSKNLDNSRVLTQWYQEYYGRSLNDMGYYHQLQQEYKTAIKFYSDACQILEASVGKYHQAYVLALKNSAVVFTILGKFEKALSVQ